MSLFVFTVLYIFYVLIVLHVFYVLLVLHVFYVLIVLYIFYVFIVLHVFYVFIVLYVFYVLIVLHVFYVIICVYCSIRILCIDCLCAAFSLIPYYFVYVLFFILLQSQWKMRMKSCLHWPRNLATWLIILVGLHFLTSYLVRWRTWLMLKRQLSGKR